MSASGASITLQPLSGPAARPSLVPSPETVAAGRTGPPQSTTELADSLYQPRGRRCSSPRTGRG